MNAFFYRNKIRAGVCLLLAALLLFCACRRGPVTEETTAAPEATTEAPLPEGSITVPYTELDSLNPFFTETLINFSLISLAYDGLFYLDGGFMPVACLAKEYAAVEQTVKVTLADSLVFSDASPLTSADVVYSFLKAKESPLYAESLQNITDCEADGSYSVSFALESPDVNAVNLLTFPVVKTGTAETAEDIPVGCGCYRYERDELRLYLTYNLRHAGGIPAIGTVRLRDVNTSSTLMHLLNTGAVDCFFTDLADGSAKRSYSGVNEIYLNNLVFLGVNAESPMLGMADLRKAVSLAISRVALAENAFVSHARAAVFPVNSSWDALADVPDPVNAKYEADVNAADAVLSALQAGSEGETLHYTLLVENTNAFLRAAAQQLAEQLAQVNMEITVNELSARGFQAALQAGEYDFYLAEIKLTKNMDLWPFFTPGGAAARGIDFTALTVVDTYRQYRAGQTELGAFLAAFDDSLPFIPLVYRNGQFCYSRSIKSGVTATEDRLYMNVAEWVI